MAHENTPYDFSRWGEDDLTQFFIHNFVMAMQGDALASFLFHDMAGRSPEALDEEIRLARRTAQAAQTARVLVPEDPEPAPLFEDWLSAELPDRVDRRGPEGDRLDVYSERLALREFTDGCSRMPPRDDGAVFAYRHEHDAPMETADVKGAMRAQRKQHMDDFDALETLAPWKRHTAVVDGVEVSREGQPTCPVGCGAIFFAPAPQVEPRQSTRGTMMEMKIETKIETEIETYDVLTRTSPCRRTRRRKPPARRWFAGFATRGARLWTASIRSRRYVARWTPVRSRPVLATHECAGGVMVEFEPPARIPPSRVDPRRRRGSDSPRDPSSASARGDPETDVLRATFRKRRHGRLVLAKFIACEDLMEEWEDAHPAPNVDARRVVTTGTALALEDFFPDARRETRG